MTKLFTNAFLAGSFFASAQLQYAGSGNVKDSSGKLLRPSEVHPGALTIVGISATLISIPVRVVYGRKVREAAEGCDNAIVASAEPTLKIRAGSFGAGLNLTF